jgi:hypothetical protein
MKKMAFAAFLLVGTSAMALAQQPPVHGGRSDLELYLSLAVLGFGLLVLGAQMAIMLKVGKGWGPNSTRISGLRLVVVSGVFLITAGYSQDQIAPMIGLLGTIAGYLLGKSEKDG